MLSEKFFEALDYSCRFWYYRSLVKAFKKAGCAPKPLIDELDRVVTKIEKMVFHPK